MRFKIPGEYDQVVRLTRHYTTLKTAHATPCTVAEARAMLKALQVEHQVPSLSVRFAGYRGRGGFKRAKWGPPQAFVSLPPVALEAYGLNPTARLRVGLVLHEFAHVVHQRTRMSTDAHGRTVFLRGSKPHGPEYVKFLDAMLVWWSNRQAVRDATPMAAGAPTA